MHTRLLTASAGRSTTVRICARCRHRDSARKTRPAKACRGACSLTSPSATSTTARCSAGPRTTVARRFTPVPSTSSQPVIFHSFIRSDHFMLNHRKTSRRTRCFFSDIEHLYRNSPDKCEVGGRLKMHYFATFDKQTAAEREKQTRKDWLRAVALGT